MDFLHSTKALLSWYESDPINDSKLSWATASVWKVHLMRECCIQRVMGGWRRGLCHAQWSLSVIFCTEGIFIYFSPFSFWDDTKEEKITPFLPPNWKWMLQLCKQHPPSFAGEKGPQLNEGRLPAANKFYYRGRKTQASLVWCWFVCRAALTLLSAALFAGLKIFPNGLLGWARSDLPPAQLPRRGRRGTYNRRITPASAVPPH